MKPNKKKEEKEWDSLKPPTPEPLPAKEIKEKDGKPVKQYPPTIGRHGTEDEKDLNVEE